MNILENTSGGEYELGRNFYPKSANFDTLQKVQIIMHILPFFPNEVQILKKYSKKVQILKISPKKWKI